MQEMELCSKCAGCCFQIFQEALGIKRVRLIEQKCNVLCRRHFVYQLQLLWNRCGQELAHAGDVTSRPIQAGDNPCLDRIDPGLKNNGDGAGRSLGRQRTGSTTQRNDDGDLALDQIGRQGWKSLIRIFRPAVFNRNILLLNVTRLLQSLPKGGQASVGFPGRCAKKPNYWHRWLLRPRRERPRDGRATEKRDELAPSQSITSSARARS